MQVIIFQIYEISDKTKLFPDTGSRVTGKLHSWQTKRDMPEGGIFFAGRRSDYIKKIIFADSLKILLKD